MKRIVPVLCVALLCLCSIAGAQTFSDYVSATKGDTVVVKDYIDMGSNPNSLALIIERDSLDNPTVPAGRVYQLKTNGLYWHTQGINSPWTRTLRIEGPNVGSIVKASLANMLPIMCGMQSGSTVSQGGLNIRNNVIVKNLMAVPAAGDGSQGWVYFSYSQPNVKLVLDGVLMEHNRWVMIQSNQYAGNTLVINNSYFVNMSGQPCRRNGGVFDNVSNPTDTIIVENSTHVMAQGMMYKFRNFNIKKGVFNHNTFVNCVGNIFETLGYQINWAVTNNLFVNSNAQGYQAGMDPGEADGDNLPMGIVNVDTLPAGSTVAEADRKILVDRNGVYWDARFATVVPYLNSANVIAETGGAFTTWVTTMIKMNTRSQALFDNNAAYPKLTEAHWYMAGDPLFVAPENLMTTLVDKCVEFCDSTASSTSAFSLLKWRQAGNEADASHPNNWTYPDWPIPVDLAYTNATYLTGAFEGRPLGDLNWFPAAKAAWSSARDNKYIDQALEGGTVLAAPEPVGVATKFEVSQNYPNPFNPTTTISLTVPHSGNVTLKVFNVLGQEVATLMNGYMTAQRYEVKFDASKLSSGVYFYTANYGDQTVTKKMTLLK